MKIRYLFLCLFFFALVAEAQITFEKGYYITNTGDTIYGLLENRDWKDNPAQFEFKESENATVKTVTLKYAREFGFENGSKYIRATVNIDHSGVQLNKLSNKRSPEFIEKRLFLKVLVLGEARLYRYEEGNMTRYFYANGDMAIEQLIYKQYLDENQNLKTNTRYKQQLFSNLKCISVSMENIKKLRYQSSSLVPFFIAYNGCKNPNYTNNVVKEARKFFHLNIRPGGKNAHLDLERFSTIGLPSQKSSLDDAWGLRLGLEAEFILPFNRDKWSIIVEPTYQNYKSETGANEEKTSVDYKSIELPLGVRHYFFLNDTSKLFINASFVLDFPLNSILTYKNREQLNIKSRNNFALGAGFKYGNRYSLEFRYDLDRKVLSDNSYYDSNYGGFSLIFGYTLF